MRVRGALLSAPLRVSPAATQRALRASLLSRVLLTAEEGTRQKGGVGGVIILRRNEEGNAISDLRSRGTHSLGGQGYRSTKQNHQKCHVGLFSCYTSFSLSLSPFLPPLSSRVSVLISLSLSC